MKEPIHILSLGAGVQSSTLALMAAKGEVTPMPSCAIFADTQDEYGEGFWICHYCKTANFRDQEGLDECDRCRSEVKVQFQGLSDRMAVCWQREPKSPNP